MNIKVSKAQIKIALSYSFFFSGLGIVLLCLHYIGIESDNFSFRAIGFSQFFVGITALIPYLYLRTFPYINVDELHLYKGYLFKKKVVLQELTSVYVFAGELVLKTPTDEVRIDSELLEKNDFDQLHQLLNGINTNAL